MQKKLSQKTRKSTTTPTAADDAATPAQPRAYLELKTYDPASGVCLKYQTDKAAEIGRLIAGLGRLGRSMAALPELAEDKDVVMGEAEDTSTPVAVAETVVEKVAEKVGGAGGGGKKKKKGGKR